MPKLHDSLAVDEQLGWTELPYYENLRRAAVTVPLGQAMELVEMDPEHAGARYLDLLNMRGRARVRWANEIHMPSQDDPSIRYYCYWVDSVLFDRPDASLQIHVDAVPQPGVLAKARHAAGQALHWTMTGQLEGGLRLPDEPLAQVSGVLYPPPLIPVQRIG
ncbi:MAG TPA: hypothetical protein VL737_03980 [Candidatus Pristimantibacillus sp.]|jgi:hypothetical protein|nr:hypothetical protein [Candidatus Pristimantibacillus sp.]